MAINARTIDAAEFGRIVKTLALLKGIKLRELADRLGLRDASLTHRLNGRTRWKELERYHLVICLGGDPQGAYEDPQAELQRVLEQVISRSRWRDGKGLLRGAGRTHAA